MRYGRVQFRSQSRCSNSSGVCDEDTCTLAADVMRRTVATSSAVVVDDTVGPVPNRNVSEIPEFSAAAMALN